MKGHGLVGKSVGAAALAATRFLTASESAFPQ